MYVGCTLDPVAREKQHRGAKSSKPIGRWMDELAAAGVEPLFQVVRVIRSLDKARRYERELIETYRKIGQCSLNGKGGRRGRFDKVGA